MLQRNWLNCKLICHAGVKKYMNPYWDRKNIPLKVSNASQNPFIFPVEDEKLVNFENEI